MRISVCIPTYNRPDLLQEAIDSCLAQTYLPAEINIGDDSKNRISEALVNTFINRNPQVKISYYKNEPSLGQLANVNMLISKASADKFVLLHDDDLLMPEALEMMLDCFKSNPGVNVAYGKQILINEDGTEKAGESEELNRRFFRMDEYSGSKLSAIEAAMLQQFPNDCYMVDMDVVKRLGYGRKQLVGNAGDFDFGFRLAKAGCNFFFIPKFTAKYRVTESSVARNGTDSGYQSFKLIANLNYQKKSDTDYQKEVLERKAPIAILQAAERGMLRDAVGIYFSKWHRNKIFSLGGMHRLSKILYGCFR